VRSTFFFGIAIGVALLVIFFARIFGNDYLFFAGYTVLQFVVLASAWNILGGYCGYVNFGTAAFFALGAYASVALYKFAHDPKLCAELWTTITGQDCLLDLTTPGNEKLKAVVLTYFLPQSMPALMAVAAIVSGLIGLGTGYLTLRLRGAFFSIATLALAVVLQTFVINWNYVGGSRGAYVIRPNEIDILGIQLPYIQYLCLVMILLAALAIAIARAIERSKLGYGFATIRDDELAAEASGVPTLKLKLIATTLSGALMGMAGAPYPYYIGYLEPASAFGLPYAVNAIAMPMIGGTTSWIGPLIGSILLGTLQQIATVTISSAVNLLIVGLLLVDCVIIAPNGIVGLLRDRRTASTLEQPTVFVLLYALNLLPMFFLTGQGQGALYFGLAFWLILFFFAYARGQATGRMWLVAFPIVGAILSLFPATSDTPVFGALAAWLLAGGWTSLDAATVAVLASMIIQVVGIVCALAPERRELKLDVP
jgi:branched-chain amino acid transport system permease protein